jgi:hypothetical protein
MPPEPTPTALPAPTATQAEPAPEGMSIQRITAISASVLGGVIVITFLIGLLFALFGSTEVTASRIQIIRDIFLIVMGLEAILIIGALAVLVVQAARLINLLNSESKPVLQNAQATVNEARATVSFVGENVTQPIIRTKAFLAGARVFMREMGGIRRAIRHTEPKDKTSGGQNGSSG